jgi:hypothetical protein
VPRSPVPGFAATLILGALAALLISCQETEEDTSQAATEGPTLAASATPALTDTPAPTPSLAPADSPVVNIPAGWQTYADPKGRFSISAPPDWLLSQYSSEDNPHWTRAGETQNPDSDLSDGVKLSVLAEPKQPGEPIDAKAPDLPNAAPPTREQITVNGRNGLKASWSFAPGPVEQSAFIFERGNEWLTVIGRAAGPQMAQDMQTFEQSIIQTLVIR